jgi:hypothetical protein
VNSFLDELGLLKKKFPNYPSINVANENSDHADNLFRSKDCYYVFDSADMQECLHVADGVRETNDVDCDFGVGSEGNCECQDFVDSNSCYGSQSFARCYNIWYGWYLVDCHDCFGCANLTNKSFCAFNVQYTEEEYQKLLPQLKEMPEAEVRRKLQEIIFKIPQVHAEQIENNNSDYCDYAYFNNNCYYCFDCAYDEDSGYLVTSYNCKDCWNSNNLVRSEQSAECAYSEDLYNCFKVSDSSRCTDSYYLEDCNDCHDCFGCVKLANKSYCILNIQYTKDEYFKKLEDLKRELGLSVDVVRTT